MNDINGSDGSSTDGKTVRNIHAVKTRLVDLLTAETENIHRTTSTALLEFFFFRHNRTLPDQFPCEKCATDLDNSARKLRDQNTVVSVLTDEVKRTGHRAPTFARAACRIVHELIYLKLSAMKNYKAKVV